MDVHYSNSLSSLRGRGGGSFKASLIYKVAPRILKAVHIKSIEKVDKELLCRQI